MHVCVGEHLTPSFYFCHIVVGKRVRGTRAYSECFLKEYSRYLIRDGPTNRKS
jgi:hypothetical protein